MQRNMSQTATTDKIQILILFQVVDMRWGVRDEATDDHMTTKLCMQEIDNCQRLSIGPNFVVSFISVAQRNIFTIAKNKFQKPVWAQLPNWQLILASHKAYLDSLSAVGLYISLGSFDFRLGHYCSFICLFAAQSRLFSLTKNSILL